MFGFKAFQCEGMDSCKNAVNMNGSLVNYQIYGLSLKVGSASNRKRARAHATNED